MRNVAAVIFLTFSILVAGCDGDGNSLVELTPADFNAPVASGDPWSVALARLPEGACSVEVHFAAPAGDGLTIGVLSYALDPAGRLVDEREGLVSTDQGGGLYTLTIPPSSGPHDLIAINQSGERDHYIFGALVDVCR